ncbi:MAG: NAD-dependent epimerase/dehydratase family protein [Planctomycetes bacterium]|nr:NAD-dependent epimerase/dehydratase family protein [Planctomycetota bacterium]
MSAEEWARRLKRGLQDYTKVEKAAKPRSLLFLGGTGFLGPHTVQYAVARGHTVTLFNRGNRNEALFPELEELRGDRDPKVGDGLKSLEQAIAAGRKWDAVIDTSGYVPRIVSAAAELLKPATKQYVFVSSISVYADARPSGITEAAAVATIADPANEDVGANYGALKALCEQAAEKAFPGRTTNVRPGYIVGAKDATNRFAYWPARAAKGGKVLAPPRADPIQFLDVRDLAEFLVHCTENETMGVFNAVGPDRVLTMGELLDACSAATGNKAEFVCVDGDFLAAREANGLPIWTQPGSDFGGFGAIANRKAIAAGLKFRSVNDTVQATWDWWSGISEAAKAAMWDSARNGRPTPEQEAEVIAAWLARAKDGGEKGGDKVGKDERGAGSGRRER